MQTTRPRTLYFLIEAVSAASQKGSISFALSAILHRFEVAAVRRSIFSQISSTLRFLHLRLEVSVLELAVV